MVALVKSSIPRGQGGIRGWLLQRLTGAYIGIFSVVAFLAVAMDPPSDFAAWRATLRAPHVAACTLVFGMAVAVHAWIGMRDIYTDYVQSVLAKALLLACTGLLVIWLVARLSLALFSVQ